jgi:hypothetical protein
MPRSRPAVDRRHDQLTQLGARVEQDARILTAEMQLTDVPTRGRSRLDPIPVADFGAFDLAREVYELAVRAYNQAHRQHVRDRCCVV